MGSGGRLVSGRGRGKTGSVDGGEVCREVTGGNWGGNWMGGGIWGVSNRALVVGVVLRLVDGIGVESSH